MPKSGASQHVGHHGRPLRRVLDHHPDEQRRRVHQRLREPHQVGLLLGPPVRGRHHVHRVGDGGGSRPTLPAAGRATRGSVRDLIGSQGALRVVGDACGVRQHVLPQHGQRGQHHQHQQQDLQQGVPLDQESQHVGQLADLRSVGYA